MNMALVSIVATLFLSGVAAAVAVRLRLPGGAIIWALAAAAALHVMRPDLGPLPEQFRTIAQILVGTVLGVSITRSPIVAIWKIRRAVLLFTVLLIAVCLTIAVALALLTPLDLATAAFAVAPGGAGDMAAASLDFGLDGALVAGLQVVRQLLVFVLVPAVFALLPPAAPPDPAAEA